MNLNKISALAVMAATLAGPAMAAEWTVGANIGNVPWEFQDAQGKFVGFEIDLVNEVAKRTGNTVKVENIPFNGLFPAVLSGRWCRSPSLRSRSPRSGWRHCPSRSPTTTATSRSRC